MANYYGGDGDEYIAPSLVDLYGGAGNDVLFGTTANNELYGGQGNDVLYGGNFVSVSGAGTPADPAVFVFGPSADDIIEGGSGNDGAHGGDGNDKIFGGEGDDAGIVHSSLGAYFIGGLHGGDGNDDLYGGGGNDLLEGGAGTDRLWGGAGLDLFEYNSILDSVKGPARDIIYDFSQTDHDLIDLRAIDAKASKPGDQHFNFIGSNPFHDKEGELRFFKHKVSGDTDGDGKIDFQIRVIGVDKMFNADFFL